VSSLVYIPRSRAGVRLPHLAEHVEQHLKPRDPDAESEFVFGLDLVLEGLERRLEAD